MEQKNKKLHILRGKAGWQIHPNPAATLNLEVLLHRVNSSSERQEEFFSFMKREFSEELLMETPAIFLLVDAKALESKLEYWIGLPLFRADLAAIAI